MTLARFVEALQRAGLEPDAQSLLDSLWLAAQIAGKMPARGERMSSSPRDRANKRSSPHLHVVPPKRNDAPEVPDTPAPSPTPAFEQALYPNAAHGGPVSRRASPIRVAGAPPRVDRLALSRALKPFRTAWRGGAHNVLDEEASVEMIARTALSGRPLVAPVLRPLAERWFSVELVVEDDRAIEVWRDELRGLVSASRMTGAFNRIRQWQLAQGENGTPLLRSSGGAQVSTGTIGGERRLILFATHGVSLAWADGRFDTVLREWARHSSVAILQLLPPEWWGRTLLGDADVQAMLDVPGAPTRASRITPAWWMDELEPGAVAIPLLPVEASGFGAWARMAMSRGAQVPAHLLSAAGAPPSVPEIDDPAIDGRLAALRENEPRAFELAVVLNTLPFTIPVARVVQEAHLGMRDSRPLAALFLSGLLEPMEEPEGAAGSWFVIRPRAAQRLRATLRRGDARKVAAALVDRVSAHIEQATGQAPDLTSFSPDAAGKFNLPSWAEPFARLAQGLRSNQSEELAGSQALRRLRDEVPREVLGKLMRDTVSRRPIRREDDIHLWDLLLGYGLTVLSPEGDRVLAPATREMLLSWYSDNPLWGISILWVDDVPDNNQSFTPILLGLGAEIVQVETSAEALEADGRFDMIISDMARREGPEEGLRLIEALRGRDDPTPVIIFSNLYPRSRQRRLFALEVGALAVTNDFRQVRDTIIDYSRDPQGARGRAHHIARSEYEDDVENHRTRKWPSAERDWAFLLNLDGPDGRVAAAGAWVFEQALQQLVRVSPSRIERKAVGTLRDLPMLLEQHAERVDHAPAATGYIYLCGGFERPLTPKFEKELGNLVRRLGDRPGAAQIILIADLGEAPRVFERLPPFFRPFEDTPPMAGELMIFGRTKPSTGAFANRASGRRSSSTNTAVPELTQQIVLFLEERASSGQLHLYGRALEQGLRDVIHDSDILVATHLTGGVEIELTARAYGPSLIRTPDEWQAEAMELADKGEAYQALLAVEAARITAPDTFTNNRAAELVMIHVALLRRLERWEEATTLLDREERIWKKTKFRADAFYHRAAIAAITLEPDAALAELERASSPAVALAVNRQQDGWFARLQNFEAFRAYLKRSLEEVGWEDVSRTNFAFKPDESPLTDSARSAVNEMAMHYHDVRHVGDEARIVLDCNPGSIDGVSLGSYENARAAVRSYAMRQGVEAKDWEDRALYPTYRAEGNSLDELWITLTAQHGPRRIFE